MRAYVKSVFVMLALVAVAAFAAGKEFIYNNRFQRFTGDNAAGWSCRGFRAFQKDGADVVLMPGDEKDTLLVQYDPKPPIQTPLVLSWEVEGQGGPARYRVYVERADKSGDGKGFVNHISYKSGIWREATPGWKPVRFELLMPQKYDICYVVLQLDKASPNPVRIRNLSFRVNENAQSCLGGYWNVSDPHQVKDNVLQLNGTKGMVALGPIAVKPGSSYRLTYTAQGIGESKTTTGYHTFRTSISPAVDGSFVTDDVMGGAQGKSHAFAIPKTAKTNMITFNFQLRDEGCVRFSDFKLMEVPVDPTAGWQCHLEKPFYRGLFFGEQTNAEIAGYVIADDTAARLDILLKTETAELKKASVSFTQGRASFSLLAERLPLGRYLLEVKVLGTDGKTLKLFSNAIRVIPPAKNMVTLLPNRYPAIDGRPFFPIMHCDFPAEQMKYSRAMGVNVVRIHLGKDATLLKRELDAVLATGMKTFLILDAPRSMHGVKVFMERVKKVLTPEVLAHPALYGYLHIDEPLWGGVPPEPMVAVYEFLKEFDPYHPVWMNTAPRNSVADLRPYAATCDILGVDIYPIPYPNGHSGLEDKTPTACGKYAQRLQEIGGPGKSIFMWLQGFRWSECNRTDDPKNRYPTKDEFRFMVYDTLLNGGNGFAIWGCQYLSKYTYPNKGEYFEDAMYPATAEASALSALFCEGRQLDDIKTSSDSVRCAVIRHGGSDYYFLLNLTPKGQQASVEMQEATPLQALGISRPAAFKQSGKAIQLELAPYEVLVAGAKPVPQTVNPCPAWPKDADQHPFRTYFQNLHEHKFTDAFCWIWDSRAHVSKGKCWAFREFDAPAAGTKVVMHVAIDDLGEVFFNGRKLAEFSGWSNLQTFDLTPLLKPGKNIVAIRGEDGGSLPCGILAQIRFGNQVIQSDASWKTVPAGDEKTPPNPAAAELQKAFLVAPYGQGAWGKGVLLP